MESYKQEFIEFMVESQVLKFGDFTLKSGRKSPFFMNAGAYVTGTQLRKLGEYYAKAIHDNFGLDFDVLFGPAYKGIPLAVATTMAISELYGKDIRYCSNRKEVKDHGDTGILLGSKLKDGDRVVMIEDVTTSGKSIEETFPIIKAQADVEIKGLMVSLNRMEKGKLIPDNFLHEQFLLIRENGRRIVFGGCAHKGIVNVVCWLRPDIYIGGFHFKALDPEAGGACELAKAAQLLQRFNTRYLTCHCTGEGPYAFLKQRMTGQLSAIRCGETVEI